MRARVAGVLDLSLAPYVLRLEREVGVDPLGNANNAGSALRSRGVETQVRARLSSEFDAYVTYAYGDTSDASGGEAAYAAPRHLASAGVVFESARTLARLSTRYLGRKHGILRHMGDEGRVQDALLVDLYVERKLSAGLSGFIQGSNLLDLTYETFQGRPMLPRTLLVGLEIREEIPMFSAKGAQR
jgi:outer membrane cobalamin receptor